MCKLSHVICALFMGVVISGVSRSADIPFCGTKIPADEQPRPSISHEDTIATAHFKVHFTTFPGASGQTTQEWVDSTAIAAEYSWQFDSADGWRMPYPDDGRGGSNLYDIYIYSVPDGHGACVPESSLTLHTADGVTSWIGIQPDSVELQFPKWRYLRSLVAHEFHHAIQFGMAGTKELDYFYEASAVYWQQQVVPDVKIINYWLDQAGNPLDSVSYSLAHKTTNYIYSNALWFEFLGEFYDSSPGWNVVRYIWEKWEDAGENTLSGIDFALQFHFSSDLKTALLKYAEWRYFTGTRADTTLRGRFSH